MNAPLRPRGVVFDMDGLLLNTEALRMQAVEDCARELGVRARIELFAALIGGADATSRAALDAHMKADLPPDFWKVYRRCVERRMDELQPMPGAIQLLDHLQQREIPCALATSATHESVAKYCAPFGLVERFQTIVARGDYAAPKPAPDAYLVAAGRLALAPADCLALEDSYSGVRAAAAAGMATIMAPDVLPATEEMRALCVAVVADLHEVRARIG
jgi:HAD superfamily hydrolase (TIGR01509 family)